MIDFNFKNICKKIKIKYLNKKRFVLYKKDFIDSVKINLIEYKKNIYIALPILVFFIVINELFLKCYFSEDNNFNALGTFFVTLSAGLVSITAIISTFIIFSMQSNLEKLPFGLFKKFSSDDKLKIYLVTTLVLSIFIGILSLFKNNNYAGLLLIIFFVFIGFIFVFLNLSFKRGLVLINPLEQLKIMEEDVNVNANFLDTINYIDSIIKRNLRVFEYDVFIYALNSLISINKIYIEKKGNNFQPYLNSSQENWNDPIINTTLDRLRINMTISLNNKDEIAINQILSCYIELIKLYTMIKDINNNPLIIHSVVAKIHMIDDIKKIILVKNENLTLNSIRKLNETALYYISQGLFQEAIKPIEVLGYIGQLVCEDREHIVLVREIMNSFSTITKYILISDEDISFILGELNKEVGKVGKCILLSPHIENNYEPYLGEYYGFSTGSVLTDFLSQLILELNEKSTLTDIDKKNLDNILLFTDKYRLLNKELFEVSCFNISFLNINQFIQNLSYLLLLLTNLNYKKEEFKRQSEHYFLIITFIPQEKEIIKSISNLSYENLIFIEGKRFIESELYSGLKIRINELLKWSFKVGKFNEQGHSKVVLGLLGASYLTINSNNLYKKEDLINCIKEYSLEYDLSINIKKDIKDELINLSENGFNGYAVWDIEKSFLEKEKEIIKILNEIIEKEVFK